MTTPPKRRIIITDDPDLINEWNAPESDDPDRFLDEDESYDIYDAPPEEWQG